MAVEIIFIKNHKIESKLFKNDEPAGYQFSLKTNMNGKRYLEKLK